MTEDEIREYATLTTQATDAMVKVGADRIREEIRFFSENGWGTPDAEHLAANAYEAMVFSVIGRGLTLKN